MKAIYKIINTKNGKFYLGSTSTVYKRWFDHKRELKTNSHHSSRLQNAWNKYGEDSFIFTIMEQCADDTAPIQLINREQYLLDTLMPWDDKIGYNISPIAGGGWMGVRSSKTRSVMQYTLEGTFIKKWDSASEVQKVLGYRVYDCLYHRNKSYKGYVWCFENEPPMIFDKYHDEAHSISIDQYTKDDVFVKTWPSASSAAKSFGKMFAASSCRILQMARNEPDNKGCMVKSVFGYKWKLHL